ncbi:hypothetical protein RBB77_23315 (plasmid) [Tunturibacter psychrotolerans]|uniref:DUF3829 domain-containing protein n=1 Tax=Tunturiibacter psychrotolerans TaxID=3069686 RepID=A0AAU7ZXM7_9BACT
MFFGAIAIALSSFVGCTDLGEVAKFSALADSASTSLTGLVSDFKGTCLRSNALAPVRNGVRIDQRDCSIYDKLTPEIQADQKVLTDYLKALGQLAADNDPGYSKPVTALGGQFKTAGLNADQVAAAGAASSLAVKISDAALAGYRRKKISKLVSDSNNDVKILTQALSNIVSTDYAIMLSNEEEGLQDYYNTAIKNDAGKDPLSVILIQKQFDDESANLQKRLDAAKAYGVLMKSIADANQKIADQKDAISSKDLVKLIGPQLADIAQSTNDLRQAFK